MHPLNPDLLFGSDIRRYFQDASRGQPKRERTKALLLDAVIDAIATEGLHGATIKEITERAGVAHGTFYNHFVSQDEAFLAAAIAITSEVFQVLETGPARPEQEDQALVMGLMMFMDIAIGIPAWGHVLVATAGLVEGRSVKPIGALEEMLRAGHSKGIFRVEVTDLLSHQIRALQSVAITKNLTGEVDRSDLIATCEAVLRVLGRTAEEAHGVVRKLMEGN